MFKKHQKSDSQYLNALDTSIGVKMKVEKLVFGGQGLGRVDNKVVFLWNALPGEEVVFNYTNNKKNFAEGLATEILVASPDRIEPKEKHFLSCSQWQILAWEKELLYKKQLSEETYQKIGNLSIPNLEIVSDDNQYNYRNKIEYNFIEENGNISLAIFLPESHERVVVDRCELARKELNVVAEDILDWIVEKNIEIRDLRKMILRVNQKGEVLAGLFINQKINLKDYPELKNNLVGFSLFQKNFKGDVLLHAEGQDYLEEEILGKKLRYGLFSFFQINVPIFQKALEDISSFISQDDEVIDYYCGVGSIGLSLSAKMQTLSLVESNKEASEYAKQNIDLNKLNTKNNLEVYCQPAEKIIDLINSQKVIILDPPRAGLEKTIIERIIWEKPKKIIYLSCNVSTQARDIGLLKDLYEIKFAKLYNFFPRTPHVEGLIILEAKKK